MEFFECQGIAKPEPNKMWYSSILDKAVLWGTSLPNTFSPWPGKQSNISCSVSLWNLPDEFLKTWTNLPLVNTWRILLSYTRKYDLSPHLSYKSRVEKNHLSFFYMSCITCSTVSDVTRWLNRCRGQWYNQRHIECVRVCNLYTSTWGVLRGRTAGHS